jgi:hypothetical protein
MCDGVARMKLVIYKKGKFVPLYLGQGTSTHYELEDWLRARYVYSNGVISELALDFEGSMIPLLSEDELRLAVRLVSHFHNTYIQNSLSVSLCL